ncbi:MAG: efflux RND transporter periplasmic adaptor subunit [Verrucomicrobia bacterium]|nr:MAG: efflux RND transporter periplasmic adaptor subunit [Verrucomicrobiota bacterium]
MTTRFNHSTYLDESCWRKRATGGLIRLGLPVALLASVCLCSCEKPKPAALPPPIVEVMEITPSAVPLSTLLIGQLDSPQNVDVRARVEAFVDEMRFTEGVEVNKGDVLFVLDKKPFLEKLGAAQGSLAEAEAALKKYQTDVARLEPLVEKKAVPQQDLDNSRAAADMGKANVLTAQSKVETAQLNLGYCEVLAPMTGLIGAKQVSIGDLVGKGEPTLLATLSTLDPMWFYCNISEVDYMHAVEQSEKLGRDINTLPLTLILSDGKEHTEPGKFVFIDRAVDTKTGTLRIRVEFPNPKKFLRPGMFARVRVNLGKRADSITVPERAMVELQGKTFVWVISDDGKASQRAVKTGDQVDSLFIILDGLKAGEKIIVEGIQKVREGIPVNAVTAAAATAKAIPVGFAKPIK